MGRGSPVRGAQGALRCPYRRALSRDRRPGPGRARRPDRYRNARPQRNGSPADGQRRRSRDPPGALRGADGTRALLSSTAASSLRPFLAPSSVAVIGASRDPYKVGGSVVANLRAAGFPGRIVPINTRTDSVQGLPAVRSLLDVEIPVDLAVIAVPAAAVLSAL